MMRTCSGGSDLSPRKIPQLDCTLDMLAGGRIVAALLMVWLRVDCWELNIKVS